MDEKEFFIFAEGCYPIYPVYYKGKWVALPLVGYKSFFGGFAPDNPRRDSSKRSVALRHQFCATLKETLVPTSCKKSELRNLCKQHDIYFPWVLGPSFEKAKKREKCRRMHLKDRKNQPLDRKQYRKLRKGLRKINSQIALIYDILWDLNKNAIEVNGYVYYVILEDILHLKIEDIPPENSEDAKSLSFTDKWSRAGIRGGMLTQRTWKMLCRYIQGRCLFTFCNTKTGPFSAKEVNKALQQAATKCGIKRTVSSLAFRSYPHLGIKKTQIQFQELPTKAYGIFCPIEESEWEEITEKIPELVEGRGRDEFHNSREKMNAILSRYHLRCSWSDVAARLPLEALKSQYKRWKAAGIVDKVMSLR